MAKITAAAVLAVIAAAGPAEAVCELLASGAAGIAGLRIGTAIGARMGIAGGGTAIAGTWPVGLTLGSLLATGTGVVLLATPAVCLALASAAGATTLAAVALAAGVTAAGAAIVVLMTENDYARGVIGRAVDKLEEAGPGRVRMGAATVQWRNTGGGRAGDDSGAVCRTAGAGRTDRRGAGMDPRVPAGIQPAGGLRDVPRGRGNRRTVLTEEGSAGSGA